MAKDPLDEKIASVLLGAGKAPEAALERINSATFPPEGAEVAQPVFGGRPKLVVDNGKEQPENVRIAGFLRHIASQVESGELPATGFEIAMHWYDKKAEADVVPFTYYGLTSLQCMGILEMVKIRLQD